MSHCTEHREFIPRSDTPAAMPKGIAVHYYQRWPSKPQEITADSLRRVMKNLWEGKWENLFLTNDTTFEQNFMQLESGGGLYALQFVRDNTGGSGEEAAWFSTFDPEYLDSDEETDIECSDGKSVICRRYTTSDKGAVMTAIEYFIRTGRLWDGIPWMKSWQEWVEE